MVAEQGPDQLVATADPPGRLGHEAGQAGRAAAGAQDGAGEMQRAHVPSWAASKNAAAGSLRGGAATAEAQRASRARKRQPIRDTG